MAKVNETNENTPATTENKEASGGFDMSLAMADLGMDLSAYQREDTESSGLDELRVRVRIPFAKFFAKTHNGYKTGSLVLYYGTDDEVVHNLNKEPLDGIQIINIAYQRAAFEGAWSKNESHEPFCKSYDGKFGAEGGRYAGQECAKCPASNWDLARKEGGKSATPPCKNIIMVLIRVPGHKSPFHLAIKGTNLKSFNEFGSNLKKTVDKYNTFAFAFRLRAEALLVEHSNGESDTIVFRSSESPVAPKEDFEAAKETLEWYREEYMQMMKEASISHSLERSEDSADEEVGEGDKAPF